MKNLWVVMILIGFVIGCGNQNSQKNESKFQGSVEGKDYTSAGFEALKNSDVKTAIQNFDLAIKQNPKVVKNYLVLGEVYLRLKNFPAAEDVFFAATRVAPADPDGFYYLALARAPQEEKKSSAIEAAQKSVELYMQNKNEEAFKRALILLRGLEGPGASSTNTN